MLIPLSGWLTRRYGNRVVFLTAIALFTLASVGCAASVNLGMLVAMRVLQGAGGAMMVPVGRTMVLSPAAKEDILRLTSFVVWPGLLAPVIAPLAGGLITTYASWHWMFLINVPLGVVAFAVAWRLVTAGPAAGDRAAAARLGGGGADLRWPRRAHLRRASGVAARTRRLRRPRPSPWPRPRCSRGRCSTCGARLTRCSTCERSRADVPGVAARRHDVLLRWSARCRSCCR